MYYNYNSIHFSEYANKVCVKSTNFILEINRITVFDQ